MYKTVIALLTEQGVPFTIHEHEVARTVADAEARLPFPKDHFLKTVAFKFKHGGWILAAVRGQDRVDYRKLAKAFGVKRSDIVQLSPKEVTEALGVEIGSVSPIPTNDNTHVIFDSNVSSSATVYCGVGRPDRTLEICLANLVQVTHGRILPLVRNPTSSAEL
ncbi:MAG: YbaK/EbsC family protein [Symploca sp. SIO1B1]|nr:YbaK/EbsC family protein [Symploca sp. SIO2D2]NER96366.1 YbaK/EbsC family protein [Symploca sp. SIO1B1]